MIRYRYIPFTFGKPKFQVKYFKLLELFVFHNFKLFCSNSQSEQGKEEPK